MKWSRKANISWLLQYAGSVRNAVTILNGDVGLLVNVSIAIISLIPKTSTMRIFLNKYMLDVAHVSTVSRKGQIKTSLT